MQVGEFTDNAKTAIVAFDFDGTINMVNNYPQCGILRPYADLVLNKMYERGVKVIIWTCRDNDHSIGLMSEFLANNEIDYHSINSSIQYAPFPYESRKIYAHMYVDDRGFGWREQEGIMLDVYKEFMTRYTDYSKEVIDTDIAEMMMSANTNEDFDQENLKLEYDMYTDGGCWNGNVENGGNGAWAYAVFDSREDQEPLWAKSQRATQATNNITEMLAIIEGIQSLPRGCKVNVYTDSGYVQFGFTRPNYLKKWMQNGWLTSSKKPVANVALWKRIAELSTMYRINMILVGGHGKDADPINRKWNDMVDNMCTSEMDYFRKQVAK